MSSFGEGTVTVNEAYDRLADAVRGLQGAESSAEAVRRADDVEMCSMSLRLHLDRMIQASRG